MRKKKIGRKNILGPKKIGLKKNWAEKKFGPKKIGPKKYWPIHASSSFVKKYRKIALKNLGRKKIGLKKNWAEKILVRRYSKRQLFIC